MKRLLLAVLFAILMVSRVNAQSTLALQEKCGEGAKKFFIEFRGQYRSDSDLLPDYTSHYNMKLDRCFIHIIVNDYSPSALTKHGWNGEIVSQYLFDVFGAGTQSQTLAYGQFKKFLDRTKNPVCKVGDKICHSEAQFEALIKPYMEE